jgi:hypothetical protein
VSDPDLAAAVAERLSAELPDALASQVSADVTWRAEWRVAPIKGDEQLGVSGLVDSVGDGIGDDVWDVAVFITDLPRRSGVRPVAAELAQEERIALVSLPGLGFFRLYRRTREAVLRLIGELMTGDHRPASSPAEDTRATRRKHGRLPSVRVGRLPADLKAPDGVRLVGSAGLGTVRMAAGMVRANQPWRLFLGLSRSLAGVFATAAYAIINVTAWKMGLSLGPVRQTILALAAVALLIAWLIVDHELWERARDRDGQRQAHLYNATTLITLTVGVLCLYAELFVGLFLVQQLVLGPRTLMQTISQTLGWPGNLAIVWFLTSAAIIGGALGSGFEDDAVVRRATYGARQRERQRKHAQDEPKDWRRRAPG